MKNQKITKSYSKMTAAELARATKTFDQGVPFDQTRPLNAEESAWWKRAKVGGNVKGTRRGRPKLGRGSKAIAVTVEKGLLERADAYAQREGLTRAQLIARGLEAVIGGSRP